MGRKRVWGLAALLAVAVLTPVAAGSTAARPLPRQLVGNWSRTFTAAGWKKAGDPDMEPFVGPYTLTIRANGSVVVASINGKFTLLPGGRLNVTDLIDCGSTGLYRWAVAGRRLTLTKLHDRCGESIGLFAGVWRRT